MKLRFRSALPPPDRATRLPLLLAALLLAAFAFQLLAVDDVELPSAGAIPGGRGRAPDAVGIARARGGAAILAGSVFAPRPSATSAAGGNPLAGMAIAGSIRIGRTAFLVVEGPGSRTTNVPLGGRIGDWRVRAIRPSEALLVRGEEQIAVPFGARGGIPTSAASTRSQ